MLLVTFHKCHLNEQLTYYEKGVPLYAVPEIINQHLVMRVCS